MCARVCVGVEGEPRPRGHAPCRAHGPLGPIVLGVAMKLQIPAAPALWLQQQQPQLLRAPAAATAESVSAAGAEL